MRASIIAIATGTAFAIFCLTALVMQPMHGVKAHANQNCIIAVEASQDYLETMRALGEHGMEHHVLRNPALAEGDSQVMDAVNRLYRRLESVYDGPLSDRENLAQAQLRKYLNECAAYFR